MTEKGGLVEEGVKTSKWSPEADGVESIIRALESIDSVLPHAN